MTIDELHDYCRYLFDKNHVHDVPDKWNEGYKFALSIRQNHPIDDHEDTTITLYDHEDTNKLNNIPAALLHLPERYAFVNSMNEFKPSNLTETNQ